MSKPTGLDVPPFGGGQMPFVQTRSVDGLSAATFPSANAVVFVRVRVSRSLVISTMRTFIGTASGNIDIGVYQSDGTTLTRLSSTGSTPASGTNAIQAIALASPVTPSPGIDYYFAVAADNTTVTLARSAGTTVISAIGAQVMTLAASFPLPSTIALGSASGTSYSVWLHGS